MSTHLLEGKIILVSGGTRGLGAGIARAAAAAGAAGIMITGRDPSAGKAVAAELAGNGTDVSFHAVDLADPLAAAGTVPATVASYGRIDCVVNSAGITTRGTLLDTASSSSTLISPSICGRRSSSCRPPCRICAAVRRPDRSSTSSPFPHTADSLTWPRTSPRKRAWWASLGMPPTLTALTGSGLTGSTSAGLRPRARMPLNAHSMEQATTGFPRPRPSCPWASSVRSLRSPSSWCSCSLSAAAWSPAQ